MNIAVKHNGSTITSRVVSYSREHKICTGIGTLDLIIENTYSTSIDPWDTIDIHENGDFKVRYYVSDISESIPDGTITLTCQDISKRLVDYFIPDTYTIDYPSYTRYWIEKFLAEAGLSYEFTTTSQGNLLSNNTALGLQPAYDQIMMLLQLSGWFMYFDGNGKAIIGSLDVDLAQLAGSVNRTDILDIKRITNDKMLRNRAVVWGQYDPIGEEYAFADVSKHTPWNYDRRDVRAMVVSNGNIPNKTSAYNIANILLKEFSKATIEKHIILWGARNYNLGQALRVTSGIWKGRGLITTFGVEMSRNGLVTNIILDERCPRLFGFFNFGDYVYVGTFGDGVWRKHMKFDHTWYNFSTGLTDLGITDLHINYGVLGAVSHSGDMYYASTEGPWIPITRPESLISSEEDQNDTLVSGVLTSGVMFSGIMSRAVIIDKDNNNVKFAVDNYSGLNMGDYFLTYSGMLIPESGIITSPVVESGSGNRAWILEYSDGTLVGDIGSGIYPIQYSGNYNMMALDLENDGRNDYVSVRTGGDSIPSEGNLYNMGYQIAQPYGEIKNYTSYTAYPADLDYVNGVGGDSFVISLRTKTPQSLIAYDNQISGYRFVVAIGSDNVARRYTFDVEYNEFIEEFEVVNTDIKVSSANSSIGTVIGIYPDLGSQIFRIFYWKKPNNGSIEFYYLDWDAPNNTWGSETLITSATLQGSSPNVTAFSIKAIAVSDTIKCLMYYTRVPSTVGGYYVSPSFMYVDVLNLHMPTSTAIYDQILNYETEEYESTGRYYYFNSYAPGDPPADGNAGQNPYFSIFQDQQDVQIIGRMEVYHYYLPDDIKSTKEYLFGGSSTVIQSNEIYSDTQITTSNIRRFNTQIVIKESQLTLTTGMFVGNSVQVGGGNSFAFNGTIFHTYTSPGGAADTDIPFELRPSAIYPIFAGFGNIYIALDQSTNQFYICNADSFSVGSVITPPTGYTLRTFFSTAFGTASNEVYAIIRDTSDLERYFVPYNFSSFDLARKIGPGVAPNYTTQAINFGNFFISNADFTLATPLAGVSYVDLGTPDWQGSTFLVLQRDGLDYNLIQQSSKPIRIDISNNSPVLTVLDTEDTFKSHFIGVEERVEITPVSGLLNTRQVRDYRYTLLETTSSGTIVGSGLGITTQILYVTESGIYNSNVDTYSGGFVIMDTISSGFAERIETSNYTHPGQFIFVTTSGDNPAFYQKDNDGLAFIHYSGLPASRATIIRLDDMI